MSDSTALLPDDFSDLLIELVESEVEFVLVGGWAVILHGHVRATDDIDILINSSKQNSERVFEALTKFGAPLSSHGIAPAHFANPGDAYRFGVAPLKIELLTQISGVTFEEANNDAQTFQLGSYKIPYIGKKALIQNKRSAARHKDLADVEELER